MEKTFEELIEELYYDKDRPFMYFYKGDILPLLKQVREATIAEAVEFCVSQDWIKTIDNLKRLPTDRIYEFENPNR